MEVDEKTRIQVREFMYKLFTSNSSYYSPAEEVAHHLGMPVETIADVLEDLFSKEHSLIKMPGGYRLADYMYYEMAEKKKRR